MKNRVLIAFLVALAAISQSVATAALYRTPQITLGSGDSPNLQSILNTMGANTNAATQQSAASIFAVSNAGNPFATLVIEVAGNKNGNVLGIYDATDSSRKAVVFTGPDSANATSQIAFTWNDTTSLWDVSVDGVASGASFQYTKFGFYMRSAENKTFYTEDSLNLVNGKPQAQALVYQGKEVSPPQIDLNVGSGKVNTTFDSDAFILAWEDRVVGGNSDRDYNDMVVFVENVVSTPEPASLVVWTLLCVVAACGVWRRHRRLSK